MERYFSTGRRNHGRLLKRLLDTWDRNGSTSGPTAWQVYDNDEDDDDDDDDDDNDTLPSSYRLPTMENSHEFCVIFLLVFRHQTWKWNFKMVIRRL
jgi:hypothetical protein